MKNSFITIDELNRMIDNGGELFAFGVSEEGQGIIDILRSHNLHPLLIIDNNKSRYGQELKGIPIASPDVLLDHPEGIVIILNSYFAEIYEQMEEMGIENVYEITDLDASAPIEMIQQDYVIREKYKGAVSENVLLYVADGFGDNIIKYPILERLSKSPEADCYYVLTDRKANFDIYKSLFKNVFQYDLYRFATDTEYRKDVQNRVNSMHFKKKICSCSSAFYCTHFDPFGVQNTNIPVQQSFYQCLDWQNGRTHNSAAEDLQKMAEKIFGWNDFDLNQKGAFAQALHNIEKPQLPERKYIAIGMGGISWKHTYKAKKISVVVEWFLKNDFGVVLLGHGKEDEDYNRSVIVTCAGNKGIIDMTSKCTAFQSMKIIEGAELFVGLDSALAHGAYALNKKGIVLMSGNNFSRRFMHKDDPNIVYLTNQMDCLGCYQCIYGKWNNQLDKRGLCFSSILPETIIDTAKELLSIRG